LFTFLYALLYIPRKLFRWLDRRCMQPTLDAVAGSGMSLPLMLCEAPLALLSYMTYETFKCLLRPLVEMHTSAHRENTWTDRLHASFADNAPRPRSAALAAISWGPRWNTHTNVHFLRVEMPASGVATFEVENVRLAGFSWQIIAYDSRQGVVGRLAMAVQGPDWLTLTVRSDETARLSIRPYVFGERMSAVLPRVRLDGEDVAGSVEFSRDRLAFNYTLHKHEQPICWPLQWHVYPLLCCRDWLPPELVRRIYLPVGNPETQWLYGLVHEGFALHFDVAEHVLTDHLVYCTVYDRASFPTLPCGSVEKPVQTLEVCGEDGFWATRVVRKDGASTAEEVLAHIRVTLVRATKAPGGWQALNENESTRGTCVSSIGASRAEQQTYDDTQHTTRHTPHAGTPAGPVEEPRI
jgi:hypothetical protein